jgi:hypothetical protein
VLANKEEEKLPGIYNMPRAYSTIVPSSTMDEFK